MTWSMNEAEFAAVNDLPAGDRYDHFVKRVADWQWVWVLEDDQGLVTMGDDEGQQYVAVWPHPRYAEASASDAWAGLEPKPIELEEWMTWLPELAQRGLMTIVFPTPADDGFVVPPLGMAEDIVAELSTYE